MKRLIPSDFKRFFRDKLFFVVCILAVIFAASTPLLYVGILALLGELDPVTEELLAGYMTAKGQFFGGFSFGNNLGLIAPLLVCIIMGKDVSFGTVRNKIICGHSRAAIFGSVSIVSFLALFGVVLAHALLTLLISLPFFPYQTTPFGWADLGYFLASLFFEMLVYLFVAAFISWLWVVAKNTGMMIVLYLAVVFGSSLIAGILQGVIIGLEFAVGPQVEKVVDILDFFQRINVFNSSATIGLGTSYSFTDVCYYVLPPLAGTAALLWHGLWMFRRKDLK